MPFKIYRSSAGSGKTFTLAKEYLKLLLVCPGQPFFKADYYRHILAVTFTNMAANEMKERILAKLADFAKEPENDPMLQAILEELPEEYPEVKLAKTEFCNRAALVYQSLLHNYTDFAVSTIDSFNNRIVRSFARDLGLPFDYEVALDTDDLLTATADLLQARVGLEGDMVLNEMLTDFVFRQMEEGKTWYVEKSLQEFGSQLFNEEYTSLVKPLENFKASDFLQASKKVHAYLQKILAQFHQIGKKAIDLAEGQGLTEKHFAYGKSGVFNFFVKCKEASLITLPALSMGTRVLAAMNEDQWVAKSTSDKIRLSVASISDQLTLLLQQAAALIDQEGGVYKVACLLRKNIFLMGIAHEMELILAGVKEDKGIVHIADFNRKINQIVEQQPVPYIYERIGEKFFHILIDEFQDTSKMQWHNLIPLLVNSLGKGLTNLVVGDAKQAIYRWRGGNADMLVGLPDVPTADPSSPIYRETRIFHDTAKPENLGTNWRSRSNIVAFNNQFFDWATRQAVAQNDYQALSGYYQASSQKPAGKEGGDVEVVFFEQVSKTTYWEATAKWIKGKIKDMSTNYGLDDMAILTNRNSEGAFIAKALLEEGIPVVSADSLLLTQSYAVRLVTGLMQTIAWSPDPLLKMHFIIGLAQYYEHQRGQLILSKGEDFKAFSEVITNQDTEALLQNVNEKFKTNFHLETLRLMAPYELAEEVIRQLNLYEIPGQQIYLQRLLDVVLKFTSKVGNSLNAFLDYWEAKKDNISVSNPGSGQAIRIMTIHKSKGLEFPVVFLPFADWSFAGRTDLMWAPWVGNPVVPELPVVAINESEQLLHTEFANKYLAEKELKFIDAFNKLYVAITRPVAELLIACQEDSRQNPKGFSKVNQLIEAFLLEADFQHTKEAVGEIICGSPDREVSIGFRSLKLFEDDKQAPAHPEKGKSKVESYQIAQFIHTNNREKIRLTRSTLRSYEKEVNIGAIYSARKQGVLLHEAFESVITRKDIPKAVNLLLKAGLVAAADVADIEKEMLAITSLPLVSAFYEDNTSLKVRNEQEIMTENGSVLRPDRLVWLNGYLAVIDYKTGRENQNAHAMQLKGYSNALKRIGYKNIRLFLIYTEIPIAVEVTE